MKTSDVFIGGVWVASAINVASYVFQSYATTYSAFPDTTGTTGPSQPPVTIIPPGKKTRRKIKRHTTPTPSPVPVPKRVPVPKPALPPTTRRPGQVPVPQSPGIPIPGTPWHIPIPSLPNLPMPKFPSIPGLPGIPEIPLPIP